MDNTNTIAQVVKQLETMPKHLQGQVLEFARMLANNTDLRGTPGQKLLHLAGSISPEDLRIMSEAIEQDCEQVDIHEW
ncbi:MAG: hypothetical protein Fur0025_48370 [Oscillatoriaceae cyanobacterium]